MIIGIGTDLCEIGRVQRALDRHGERFARKILVESELDRFRQHRKPAAYLAKRFAAKEAFSKAMGTGIHFPVNWHNVSVDNERSGRPMLRVLGAARGLAAQPRHHDRAPQPQRRDRHGLRVRRAGGRLMRPTVDQALGPVMVDVQGLALDAVEREMLAHPLVGGVILFARNFQSPAQLRALTAEIRALRDPELLIAVDHEGGRVQRFKEGFSLIPAMRRIGELADRDRALACATAEAAGYVLARELLSHGVDFSFAPVLDVDFGASGVIGDRAFAANPALIAAIGGGAARGMAHAGMAGVGKHFPGHGYVRADSHVDVPVDERDLAQIEAADLVPYRLLIPLGLAGVMPAHVIYPKVDPKPAGFSEIWLKSHPARAAGIRRHDLQRRPVDGGSKRRGGHRRTWARPHLPPAATWCWCAMRRARPRGCSKDCGRGRCTRLAPGVCAGVRPGLRPPAAQYAAAVKLLQEALA